MKNEKGKRKSEIAKIDVKNGENIKFSVKGYGHGVGMSQTGADSMAKAGANYEEIIKHLETETARVSRRYDETMDAVDMYFEEVTDTLDILNTMQRLNDEQLEDIDREIAKARKMQLRTHIVCAIAMISSIASIVLTIILE